MSSSSRDGSRDRAESPLKHQHSFSDSGRASVPMWDSSDPERAPPPLPLNPGTSSSPATRAGTSARIEEAAALITARARDNAPSAYTVNTRPSSPEKSLARPQHKRMQSIQTSNVSRLSDSLERRSPEKSLIAPKLSEYEEYRASRSPERNSTRSGSETPTPTGRVTPSLRPILSENTPPSATMLALQSMRNRQESEAPLANITNNVASLGRTPPMDALSSQILSLTNIATNLQREMAQLSRRSKDNATDLIALKEATNSRDEDIRKSLRDLVSGLDTKFTNQDPKPLTTGDASRSTPNLGLYLDNKAHNNPTGPKNFLLPRIPSPTSFSAAIDRGITNSPTVVTSDGATSIALLEKVLREMATRDGQDAITKTLENVKRHLDSRLQSQSPQKDLSVDPAALRKLEEILELMQEMREASGSRALVRANSGGQTGSEERSMQRSTSATESASTFVNDEIMKMLKNVKQSISQGGGLTNEVKALVRELRGEVLGMGRDIARKIDKAEVSKSPTQDSRSVDTDELAQIVQTGIAELKEHMHHIVKENRRQSSGSTRSIVDTQEVVHAVRSALAEMPRANDNSNREPPLDREELLASIKEAWEDCKPEIALEHFGLERDEILDTLKEGLKSYQPENDTSREVSASYEDVLEAVQRGMADFRPPPIETEASITKEEVMATVRECLESFDFPAIAPAPLQSRDLELTREEILETVKEGLLSQPPVAKEIEFNRKDLFAAIKASLEGENNPLGGMGERVLDAMHDFLSNMKSEFQQYSAANGKDTEQVLDALKDGLEDLRADIETYVDRASDVTGKDEIIDTVKSGFAGLQAELDKGFSSQGANRRSVDTPELLDAMEKEFEHLRDTISKSLARPESSSDKDDILDAIRDISDDRQSSVNGNNEDMIRLVKEELEHLRTTLASTLIRSGGSIDRDEVLDAIREGMESTQAPRKLDGNESLLSNTSELLDAFQDGVEGIRSDMQKLMDRPADMSTSYEILDTLKAGLESVRNDIERLHEKQNDLSDTSTTRDQQVIVHDENLISTEIEGLKVMITQLRIKVEALDNMPMPQPAMPSETRIHKDDLDELHTAIKEVHHSVNHVRSAQEVPMASNAASKDDTDAIETLLRNVKARLEEINISDFDGTAKTTHLDSVEDMLKDMKATIEDSTLRAEVNAVTKEDLTMVELLLKEVSSGTDELQSKMKSMLGHEEAISKADIHAIEALCLDTKTQIDELAIPHPDLLPTKDDILGIKESLAAVQEQMEANSELTGQAFEARKTEHGGLANKLEDVKGVLGDLRDELIEKLEGPADGIVELHRVLEAHHDSMGTYATAASMAQLSELVNREFERHMDRHVQSKSEAEDRDSTLIAKHDEVQVELRSKIEDKFDELMTKYDDAQLANDAKLIALEARDSQHLDATTGTKAVVEDMKVLVDALGTSVSESCDRMSDDLKTVYVRVDETSNKIGEVFASNAHEHGMTREEVGKTLATALRLEGTIGEQQPAMMAGIREILGLIGQHYEHSQRQTENFARATEEIKSGVEAIPSSIPPLLPTLMESPPPLIRDVPAPKEYDDSQVHEKLNNLISHAAIAKEAFASIDTHHKDAHEKLTGMDKLGKLDQIDMIHDQVVATAAELSAMVAIQTKLMTDHHESRAAEATHAEIALEKRTAQKEKVEADIVALHSEKEALIESMSALRREHEELNGQTKHLIREVAKLETALNIRTEEMRDMNSKAESLERRILEGVMNHARSVHMSKPNRKTKITPAERDASMSLKRVPSSGSTVTTKTSVNPGSAISSAVGMALKKRTPLGSGNSTVSSRASGVDRRILSTSNVSGNRGRDAPQRALMLAPASNATGLVNLKRSHSVKSNPSSYLGNRKASWNGTAAGFNDKENHVLDESHEDNSGDDATSDTGTERRTSYTGTYTDSLAYGTGSSLSTDGARTVSYASSIAGAVGGQESIEEEDEPEETGHESSHEHESSQEDESAKIMALLDAPPSSINAGQDNSMAMTTFEGLEMPTPSLDGMSDLQPPKLLTGAGMKYHPASDSGIGTEPLTADDRLHGEAQEYFDMSGQDIEAGR